MVSKVHFCLGLDAFSQIDTSTSFCGHVILRAHHSSWTPVLSGVPQGTLLGPISFLIYINDISRNIKSNSELFADDMKVYRILRDTKKDIGELQKDRTRLEYWSND